MFAMNLRSSSRQPQVPSAGPMTSPVSDNRDPSAADNTNDITRHPDAARQQTILEQSANIEKNGGKSEGEKHVKDVKSVTNKLRVDMKNGSQKVASSIGPQRSAVCSPEKENNMSLMSSSETREEYVEINSKYMHGRFKRATVL